MIRIVSYEGQPAAQLLDRAAEVKRDVTQAVEAIVEDVPARRRSRIGLLRSIRRCAARRPSGAPGGAGRGVFPRWSRNFSIRSGWLRANIERFHRLQNTRRLCGYALSGVVVGQRVLPLASAGLYVPRWHGPLSLQRAGWMPFRKIAGVETIVMATPRPARTARYPPPFWRPQKSAGVRTVVRAGRRAIAAASLGTQIEPKVDVGVRQDRRPRQHLCGHRQAKLCYARGLCDIDMTAGPSEIMIVSDAKQHPVHLAADLFHRPSMTGFPRRGWP